MTDLEYICIVITLFVALIFLWVVIKDMFE